MGGSVADQRDNRSRRSAGMGIGWMALTFDPPVLPSGTQMRLNSAAARIRVACPSISRG